MNMWVAQNPASPTVKGSRTWLQVAPVIGFSSSGLSISGDGLYESFDFNRSNDPVLGLVLDLSSSRLGNHLSFQLGTEWSKSEFHSYFEQPSPIYPSRTTYYDASLNSISMKLPGGAKYNFTRGRVRPSAGGGLEVGLTERMVLFANIKGDMAFQIQKRSQHW